MKWNKVKLGTVTNNLDGKRKPLNSAQREAITKKGLYPYIGANNIMGLVDEYLFNEEILCIAEDGGSWGRHQTCAVIYNEKCWVNNHAHVLTAKSGTDLRYLKYYLNQQDLNQYVTGSTRGKLTKGALQTIEVPLPPLDVQQQVANLLETADNLRRKDRELLRKYEDLAQSIFHEMFGELSASDGSYPVVHLRDLADSTSGITKNARLKPEDMVEVPYLRVANVQDGYLNLDEIKTITASARDVAKYQLQKGDIVITEGGDPDKLGRGTVWNEEVLNCSFQNHIFRIRVSDDRITPYFLSKVIGSKYGKAYFLKAAKQTTGIATINSSQLKAFPVILPPKHLQVEYEAKMARLSAQKQLVTDSAAASDHLMQTLLQSSFA